MNPFDNEPFDGEVLQLILLRTTQALVFMLALCILVMVSYAPV